MSQAQDAMLGNLPNGIVTTLASHYVTNVMNADPETKLRYGQNAPLGSRPSRLVTCFVYLTLAMDHSRVSFLYAPVDDKPKNSVEGTRRVGSVAPAARDSAGAVIRDVVFVHKADMLRRDWIADRNHRSVAIDAATTRTLSWIRIDDGVVNNLQVFGAAETPARGIEAS